jgi:hypothetical protein
MEQGEQLRAMNPMEPESSPDACLIFQWAVSQPPATFFGNARVTTCQANLVTGFHLSDDGWKMRNA